MKTFFVLFAVASSAVALADGFVYSGRLMEKKENASAAVADAEVKFFVRLYDDSEKTQTSKTNAIWGRQLSASVRDGYFSLELDDGAGLPLLAAHETLRDALANLSGSRVTVGVTPVTDDNSEISPRQTLASVPFAVNAADALGTRGDLVFGGEMKAVALSAAQAKFNGEVVHDGDVSFGSDPKLASLTLADGEPLSAAALAVDGAVEVANVHVGALYVSEASATLSRVDALAATNLSVVGSAQFERLAAADGKTLTVADDAAVSRLKAAKLVFGKGVEFFNWKSVVTLTAAKEQSAGYYSGDANSGSWTAPSDQNQFVSLSFRIAGDQNTTITVGGATAAKISTTKLPGSTWLPFQTFLKKGETISWSGSAEELKFTCRGFSY